MEGIFEALLIGGLIGGGFVGICIFIDAKLNKGESNDD